MTDAQNSLMSRIRRAVTAPKRRRKNALDELNKVQTGALSIVPARPRRHSWFEDAGGIWVGCLVASFGMFILEASEQVTGGTAGLALLLNLWIDLPFWLLFLLVTAPFFVLALSRKGINFMARTAVCIVLTAGLQLLHQFILPLQDLAALAQGFGPLYTAVLGNVLVGLGVLATFRHGGSLGGFNIVALIAQEQFHIRGGYVQMVLDLTVVLASLFVVTPLMGGISAIGAITLSLVIAMNHVPGRYTGY
ncbi:MAG: YitT family protein [Micrococcus sp.]|nr:YitT family protein [Micrococcus sp.]